jgi:uncharacterized membrane protein
MKLLPEKDYHELFRIGILVKALGGIVETVTGIVIYFTNYTAVNGILLSVFHQEIAENPRDLVWGYLISEWHHFLLSSHTFWGLLFIIHGTIKLFLAVMLLKDHLWAYPTAMAVFTVFAGYELYSSISQPSLFLWAIGIFDAIVVILIIHEYHHAKKRLSH